MRERNNGIGEDNILHNQFTKYFTKAAERKAKNYFDAKHLRADIEEPYEFFEDEVEVGVEPDWFEFFSPIERLENERLQKALRKSKERDVRIFLSKALYGKSIPKIARELNISESQVTSAYYRMLIKLRREIGGDAQ